MVRYEAIQPRRHEIVECIDSAYSCPVVSHVDPSRTSAEKKIRQILGAVSEFDKAMAVAKLKGARDRIRRSRGRCEGRRADAERQYLILSFKKIKEKIDAYLDPSRTCRTLLKVL
jgi:hypothetical protein